MKYETLWDIIKAHVDGGGRQEVISGWGNTLEYEYPYLYLQPKAHYQKVNPYALRELNQALFKIGMIMVGSDMVNGQMFIWRLKGLEWRGKNSST